MTNIPSHGNGDKTHNVSRRDTLLSALAAAAAVAVTGDAGAAPLAADRPPGGDAFDFFIGRWRVAHRRLKDRLVGSTQWETFDGSSILVPLLGGLANLDENVINFPAGRYEACSLRLFNAAANQWGIWWIDARLGTLGEPVYGAFENGIGTFYGTDTHHATPVDVRFIWRDITRRSAHWEQAFSVDSGATWETNWHMDFERME